MVTVRQQAPLTEDGRVDLLAWVEALGERVPLTHAARVHAAARLAERVELDAAATDHAWASGISGFETGLEMAEILGDLRLDEDAVVAALLYRAVREGHLARSRVSAEFGDTVATLIEGVQRMAAISTLQLEPHQRPLGSKGDQIENVRKMLIALIDDVRVALIKLAERTCAIRAAKNQPAEKRERVAREIFDVYAPLAHRLGIGQLRWELEDLSFRYLEPGAYKRIASLLNERRQERQEWIDSVVATLQVELERAGIPGEVYGRAKHIYSIWRKMQRKRLDFERIYDVRAVRILVDELHHCYAALGIVHTLWRHIPHEFDDYIANPKENGYRSIHTAVLGPEGRTLEVQIRTHEMHVEAELGVCAHWSYKGSDVTGDEVYEAKMAWLRNVLDWQEEIGDLGRMAEELREDLREERIYLLTPDGHVVDLIAGATPIDFAYRIHTEVGHRCRGARVDGRVVSLNHALSTGERVEIVTSEAGEPHRDWLNPNLGYVKTPRARAKIQSYLRARDRRRNIADGYAALEREIDRLALGAGAAEQIAKALAYEHVDALAMAIGTGEASLNRIRRAAEAQIDAESQLALLPDETAPPRLSDELRGVGNLSTRLAQCCRPRRGDAIVGFAASAEEVVIHRQDCSELLRLYDHGSGGQLQVEWAERSGRGRRFRIRVDAYDRAGLLRDVSAVLAEAGVDVTNTAAHSDRDRNRATIHVDLELEDLEQLGALMDRIGQIRNVDHIAREPDPSCAQRG